MKLEVGGNLMEADLLVAKNLLEERRKENLSAISRLLWQVEQRLVTIEEIKDMSGNPWKQIEDMLVELSAAYLELAGGEKGNELGN
jgi:hypothetical protein